MPRAPGQRRARRRVTGLITGLAVVVVALGACTTGKTVDTPTTAPTTAPTTTTTTASSTAPTTTITTTTESAPPTTASTRPVGTAPASSSSPPVSTPSSGSPSASAPAYRELTATQARDALLTVDEVYTGFVTASSDLPDYPPPCTPTGAPLDTAVKPAVRVAVSFHNPARTIDVNEVVAGYGSAARAASAFAYLARGFDCSSGRLGTIPVTIGAAVDTSKGLGTPSDRSQAWALTTSTVRESYVVTRLGPQLVIMVFGETATASDTGFDAAGIVRDAVAKVAVVS